MGAEQIQIPFFYNTTKLKDPELQARIDRCKGEERQVYDLMIANPERGVCWFELEALLGQTINECSAKRCLSNLKKKKYLIKTDDGAISPAKAWCHKYKFNIELLDYGF